jgi:hypothetical protein
VIEPGINGLVEPLFDVDRLSATALKVLEAPAGFLPLREGARATIQERYSLDVTIPPLKDYLGEVASGAPPKFGDRGA